MAKRVGLFLGLVLGFLVTLIILGSSASAHKIVWKITVGSGSYLHCSSINPGERDTFETSRTTSATKEAMLAIFGPWNEQIENCYVDSDGCDFTGSDGDWDKRVCTDGTWYCHTGDKRHSCDQFKIEGTWDVISYDSCGDGYCTGAETPCSCSADCGTSPTPCCVCSTGSCCDGCNYKTGSDCGIQTCPPESYYKDASNNCHRISYTAASCTKTCDSSGNCNDCCSSQDLSQSWACGICKQKNLSSCTGSVPPLCENSPFGSLCTSDSNSCTNDICSSGVCTHPLICAGTDSSCGCTTCSNCNSQDGYYDTSPLVTQWVSTGECTEKQQKQQVYRNYYCSSYSCTYTSGSTQWVDTESTRNKAEGTQCTTTLSQPGTCIAGTCVPKPLLFVSAALTPLSINIGEQSTLSGTVTCSNAHCGTVYVYPKSPPSEPLDNISGLNVQCIPGNTNCYYVCQNMNAGSSCNPRWTITGKSKGTYPMFLRVTSTDSNVLSKDSSPINLAVNEIPPGTLSVELYTEPPVVTVGSTSTVRAVISCLGTNAQCGNVTSSLSYSGSLSINPATPQRPPSCMGMKTGGQPCLVNWTVNSSGTGSYNLYVRADSDNPQVTYKNSQTTLTVVNKPVIQISNLNLSRNPITKGEATTLSGQITCQSNTFPCGTVKASLRYNGTAGLAIPNPEINCGNMTPSATCPVSWGITGNTAGTYALNLTGYSVDSSDVLSMSATKILDVSKNLGILSIPWAEFNPQQINITNSTALKATVNCSTNYCGSVNVNLAINPPAGLSGDLSQKNCYSFPCNPSWSMTGNSEGSFIATLTATSNESIQPASSATPPLVVKGPNPLLGMSTSIPSVVTVGKPAQIKANVTCYVRDCGQTAVRISYSTPAGWTDLSSWGDVYLTRPQENPNPRIIPDMPAGQSMEIGWEANFTATGAYELGIFASGSSPDVKNAEQKVMVNALPLSRPDIEILSPADESVFSMGDVVSMKARITRDGEPAKGLSPGVAALPDLFNASLYDDGIHGDDLPGDGIYGGSVRAPSKPSDDKKYRLIFKAEESENSVYILIDPTLYVTAKTDKMSYIWREKIRISGEVSKKGLPIGAGMAINIALMQGNWSDEIKFNATGSYSYVYENRFMPNIDGTLGLKITAQDEYMNSGWSSAEVSISSLKGDSYALSFHMSMYNYTRGETMPIAIKVSDMNVFQSGINVTCKFFGDEITLEEMDGLYRGSYSIPVYAQLGEQSLSCSASGPKPGSGNTKVKIEPMPLRISVIKPQMLSNNILPVVSRQTTELKVAILYPDNTPVTDAVVMIVVGNETKNLTYSGIPGIYKADTIFSGAGLSVMHLEAQDAQGNYGQSNITVAVDTGEFNWWWLLLIPAGLVILFVVYLYMKSKEEAPPPQIQIHEKIIKLPTVERVREVIYRPVAMPQRRADPETRLKQELSRLEEKSRTTQDAKDLAEQQYYKRQIDEATFNKLMQNYEEKLIELDAAIRQKKKELYEMEPE